MRPVTICNAYVPWAPGYEVCACVVIELEGAPGERVFLHRSVGFCAAHTAPWQCSEYRTGFRLARGATVTDAWERGLSVIADHGVEAFLAQVWAVVARWGVLNV